MPHNQWGETPCAFVELSADADTSANQLRDWCRTYLAGYKVPGRIVFMPIPRTTTGKIQKFLLREQARALAEDVMLGMSPDTSGSAARKIDPAF
jgi:fatty-acyl-CoA synthase